jgi:RimJ/RimL family protein N-acetyltransferase
VSEPVVLTGEHVRLSVPTEADIDVIAEYCAEQGVQRYTTVPSPYRRSDAEGFVREHVPAGWANETAHIWAIRIGPDDRLIGMIDLHSIDSGAAEIGYWLAAGARGHGHMSDAVRSVCDYGFAPEGLELQRIEWFAYVGNVASARVVRRAGFRFEGLRRLGGLQRGSRQDEWSAALLATDPREPADGWPTETVAP